VIVYLDPSVLARAYLGDETGHGEAVAMLEDPELGLITGTWSRVEISGALVRAARAGRGDEKGLLSLLDADLATDGPVTVVARTERRSKPKLIQAGVLPLRLLQQSHLDGDTTWMSRRGRHPIRSAAASSLPRDLNE
jgi:hypothetical protein